MAVECWSAMTSTGLVRAVVSDRGDGDFHATEVDREELERRRRALVDLPWTMLDEHHGTTVVTVDGPGAADGARGDVAVTDAAGAVLGVWVGDCAPVLVVTPGGRIAAVHAGWRGLAGGVLDAALDAVGAGHGGAPGGTVAYIGPCIGPCCYEFGTDDLVTVALGVGVDVASITGRTTAGRPALDVAAAVGAALGRRGVRTVAASRCTACDTRFYSHRARDERGRHVVAVWKETVEVAP